MCVNDDVDELMGNKLDIISGKRKALIFHVKINFFLGFVRN